MEPGRDFGDTWDVTTSETTCPAPNAKSPATTARAWRIFVVEDHAFMRRNIVACLTRQPGLAVCGEAEDAESALVAIAQTQPDLVLTDLNLKATSGLELIRSLRAIQPTLPVVATTMFDVRASERDARAAGATGFVSKQSGPDALVQAIQAALANDSLTSNL